MTIKHAFTTSSAAGHPIFAIYKRQRYEAILHANNQVYYNGKVFRSPSGAAGAITGGNGVNGWRFWRFLDDQGQERLIDHLRERSNG
jgi:hypothetical protein